MLIDARNFWKLHGRWFVATALAAAAAVCVTWLAATRSGRWPGGGSATGLTLGATAGAIFFFEAALALKKTSRFRTARWAGRALGWMKAHIWLGLLTVPLVILHSGGRVGGTLTTLLIVIFAIVIVSGIWGLALQNLLPKLLVDASPSETVYSQIDRVGHQYAAEAQRLVVLACGGEEFLSAEAAAAHGDDPGGQSPPYQSAHIRGAERHVGLQVKRSPQPASALVRTVESPAVRAALVNDVRPYLQTGQSRLLGSRQRNQWYFDDLRLRVAPELRGLVDQLDELVERRRQLSVQGRIHFWLHNWLWLHLPLSIALLLLLVGHVVMALRFD